MSAKLGHLMPFYERSTNENPRGYTELWPTESEGLRLQRSVVRSSRGP